MKATVYWSADHGSAAVKWSGAYNPQEPPATPINAVLDEMYNQNREGGNLQLYMWEVWDVTDKINVGLLFAESMDDTTDDITRALWQDIIDTNLAAPPTGRYEPKEYNA